MSGVGQRANQTALKYTGLAALKKGGLGKDFNAIFKIVKALIGLVAADMLTHSTERRTRAKGMELWTERSKLDANGSSVVSQ